LRHYPTENILCFDETGEEESELQRRLVAVNLTPEEEAAIRKRLAEIEAARQKFLQEVQPFSIP